MRTPTTPNAITLYDRAEDMVLAVDSALSSLRYVIGGLAPKRAGIIRTACMYVIERIEDVQFKYFGIGE